MLRDVLYLFVDFLETIKFFLLGFFNHNPPEDWMECGHSDVVLIQGLSESWILMRKLGQYFSDKGFRVHILKECGHMYGKVEDITDKLNNYTKEHNLKNYYLVGHSKGGKVAKYYAQNYANDIKGIVFISTPHHGSLLGHLKFFNLDQLKIRSNFIKEIQGHSYQGIEILNIYGRIDNFILPNSSLVLNAAGENNIQVDVVGHTVILKDEKTFEVVDGFFGNI